MNDFKKRKELYKKWYELNKYINLNVEKISFDRAQQLREEETKYFNEWKKLDTLNKLKEKIEKEKIYENNIKCKK